MLSIRARFKVSHSDNLNSVFIFKLLEQLSGLLLFVFNKFETRKDNLDDLTNLRVLSVKRVNRMIQMIDYWSSV